MSEKQPIGSVCGVPRAMEQVIVSAATSHSYYGLLNQRMNDLLRIVTYRRVSDRREMDKLKRLRYDCYLRQGLIKDDARQLLYDEFDEMQNTINVSVYIDNEVVSAIRMHVLRLSDLSSPSICAFPDVIVPLVIEGFTLIDPTFFVVDGVAARRYTDLSYATLRIPFAASQYFGADIALASVRKEHMRFYNKVLKYVSVSDPRQYLQLIKPLGLMAVNCHSEGQSVIDKYPFFECRPGEFDTIFDHKACSVNVPNARA